MIALKSKFVLGVTSISSLPTVNRKAFTLQGVVMITTEGVLSPCSVHLVSMTRP